MSLSLFTQLRPAQVSGDSPPSRQSSGSLSVGQIPNINSIPTVHELHELQIELDYQCLQTAAETDLRPSRHELSAVNSIVSVAIFLSKPLNTARYPGTFLFQEVQLRALVSCLALLHYHSVRALTPAVCDEINTNIGKFFQQISFQLPTADSTLSDLIRYTENAYVIRLVSQYLSFIRRGDSVLPSVVGPIVKIFFASVAVVGHQYDHVLQILQGFGELCSLWRTPQKKYTALFGLQEYTRLASSLCRESPHAINAEGMRRAAATIVPALIDKVYELLLLEDGLPPSNLRGQWPRLRSSFGLGTPDLNQGYYFLGLLDCAAQLALHVNPAMLRVDFIDRIMCLIIESTVRQYTWMAIKILLSHQETRAAQVWRIRMRIEGTSRPALRETLLQDVSTIRDLLNNDEEANLRLNVPQSLAMDARLSQPDDKPPDEMIEGPEQPNFTPITPTLSSDSYPSGSSAEIDWLEAELPKSKVTSVRSFSMPLRRSKGLRGRESYDFAGLSNDCTYAYLYNENDVSVFYLSGLGAQTRADSALLPVLHLGKDFRNGASIFDVVMSEKFLIMVTNQNVRAINVRDEYELEASQYAGWDFSGVACSENETCLTIALGQGQGNTLKSSKGRIVLFKYERGARPRKLSLSSTIDLPARTRPKWVSLDADGRVLTCVTAIQNKILIWHLDDDLFAVSPFDFVKNHYRVESNGTGITSTSLYTSPSQKQYILATTSPSSERHRNNGEWSFSLPLPLLPSPSDASITPAFRSPPGHTVHDFEQFRRHRPLRTGAVSSMHHIFAVMEDGGRVSMLPLMAAEGGGVCGGGMRILEEWKGGAGGSLRFGRVGERLVAVDTKGRGMVVEFERET